MHTNLFTILLFNSLFLFSMIIPHMHFKCQGTLVRLSQKSWLLCQDPENIKFSTIYTSERKYPLAQNKKKRNLLLLPTTYCRLLLLQFFLQFFLFSTNLLLEQRSIFPPPWHNFNFTTLNITFYCHGKKIFYSSSSHTSPQKFAWSIVESSSGRKFRNTNWK